VSRDAADCAAAENDLAAIVHRAIRKEPYDIGTDHNGRDQKSNLGLPIHVVRPAIAIQITACKAIDGLQISNIGRLSRAAVRAIPSKSALKRDEIRFDSLNF
jgi:hypothetical protein